MAGLNFTNPGQDTINPAFAALLGDTAKEFGGLRINSGYRSPERNRQVGGAKRSFHMTGNAVDIDMSGLDEAGRSKLVQSLRSKGANGFITYSNEPDMLHVDMRPGKPHFMHDKTAGKIGRAPKWFQEIASGNVDEQGGGMAALVGGKTRDEMTAPARKKVSDPAILAKLNGIDPTQTSSAAPTRKKVSDPALLEKLNGAAKVDPATNQPEGVPEFVPPGVEGYDPQTGEVSRTGATDKIGAFLTSAIDGIPIAGPTLKKAATGAAAGVVSGIEGEDFGQVYDQMSRNTAELEQDNPIPAGVGYLAGAVLPTIGVGMTALGGRAMGVAGNSLLGRTAASGASNALIAGADTAARGGTGADVATQGGISGLIGLAIPGAGAAMNSIGRAIGETVTPRLNALVRPGYEAERRVGKAVAIDAANSGAPILGQADEASAALNNQNLLNVDRGGETTRALARSATNTDPEARAIINKTAQDRWQAQGDRAQSFIQRITGGATDDMALKERLKDVARKTNKPAYDKAFGAPAAADMASPELLTLLKSPALRQAATAAETRGANRAVVEGFETVRNPFVFDEAGNASMRQGVRPTLQFWDQVKRNLDSEIGKAQRAGDKTMVADMTGLKTRLVSELDSAVPEYAAARQGAASFFGAEDALEAGKKFVTMNRQNSEVAAALKKMKPVERATFAVGFASEMKDAIGQSLDRTNVINKIFGSQQAREKIKLALGPKAYGEFEQFVKVEHSMDMLRDAMGNSKTAQYLVELGLAGGGAGYGAFTGDWNTAGKAMLSGAIVGLARRGGARIDEKVTKRVAELLMAKDPAALQKAVTLASNSPKAAAAVSAIQSAISSALRGAGNASTRPERQPLEITVSRPANAEPGGQPAQ